MKFIIWLRSSFQGKDGRSSARALTNFWYVILNSGISICIIILAFVIVSKTNVTVNNYAVDAMWALIWLSVIYNLTILLIFGIISIQNVIELSKSIRGEDESKPEIRPPDPVKSESE